MTEQVIDTETVEFLGRDFHVAELVGSMPLIRYAKLSTSGVHSRSIVGLAAMFDLLEQCIHPDEWDQFQAFATDQRADDEQLLKLVAKVMGVVGRRPTRRSSDSSDGPRTIEPSSTVDSSSPDTGPDAVIRRLNAQGRPDLALVVYKRQQSLSA